MLPQTTRVDNIYSAWTDGLLEASHEITDPNSGPAESWPAWTDSYLWELGQHQSPDLEWIDSRLARNFRMPEPTDADIQELAQWSESLEGPLEIDLMESRILCEIDDLRETLRRRP